MTFRAFVDRHPDPVWIVDRDFARVLHANPVACRESGATREALLARAPATLGLNRPSDLAEAASPGDLKVEQRLDVTAIDWQGTPALLLTAERGGGGQVANGCGVAADIDAHERTEAALRDGEARYRSLLDLLPVAVWEEDWSALRDLADRLAADGVTDLRAHLAAHPELLAELQKTPSVITANPAAAEIFAVRDDEDVASVHTRWFESAEAHESYLDEVVAFLEGVPPEPRELPVQTASGRPLRVIQRLGFDGHSETPNRVVHCLTDITARVRVEERMRVVADLVSDVIWDHDLTTGEIWCSEGFRTRYGHDPADIARTPEGWVDLIHPEDRARVAAAIARAEAAGDATLTNEYRFRRADGSYAIVEDRMRVLHDGAGNVRRRIGVMVDVTAARTEAERQRALVEIGSDAAFEYDPASGVFSFGEGFRTVFGLDLVGAHSGPTPLQDHIHPEDRATAVAGFHDLLASGARSNILQYRLRRGDGGWAHVQQRNIVFRNDDGTVRRACSVLVDITAQRQSEERLRLAAQASREVIFDWDLASDRMQCSGALQERYGYDPQEFPGTSQKFIDRVHPQDRQILQSAARSLRRGEGFPELHEARYRLLRADGSIAHVISRAIALHDAAGQPVRLVGMLIDVSDLHRDEERMRAILEVSADAVWEYHPATETIVFSDGIRRHFGHDWVGEHHLPSPWRAAVHPEDLPRLMRALEEFMQGRGVRCRNAFRMKRGDGSWAHVEVRMVALRDEQGRAIRIIGSFDDVTERTRLHEQLQTAQKMESIGRIAGGIAHDFNNLLAVIMGNAELVTEKATRARAAEFANEIVEACDRGAELTRRLLSFARRSHLAPRVVNLNDTVAGMRRLITGAIPESIDLQIALAAGLWNTRADQAFVESSLLNLVVNARDAMPDGGRLTIETRNLRISEGYVAERGEELAAGRYVMLAVSDTGCGIAGEILDKVIEPFFTTKGPHLGTGLGLAMVHGFVRQSGGTMRIYSETGVGTTVKLLLPAEDDGVEKAVPAPADPARTESGGARILLVEDEEAVRRTIARILTERGHKVVEAESGDAALTVFESAERPFDILLSDVVMPGRLQGPMLATELAARAPGLGIVFMSGYANEAAVHGNGLRRGDLFLMKPIQRRELLQVIAALHDRLRAARPG